MNYSQLFQAKNGCGEQVPFVKFWKNFIRQKNFESADFYLKLMRLFQAIKIAIGRMPSGLRTATFLCALFSVCVPLSFLPGWHINDTPVSITEFWLCGGGPIVFTFGIVCGLLAYGFLCARRWSRSLFVIAILSLTFPAVYFDPAAQVESFAIPVVFGALAFWYVFYRKTVRIYFSV